MTVENTKTDAKIYYEHGLDHVRNKPSFFNYRDKILKALASEETALYLNSTTTQRDIVNNLQSGQTRHNSGHN